MKRLNQNAMEVHLMNQFKFLLKRRHIMTLTVTLSLKLLSLYIIEKFPLNFVVSREECFTFYSFESSSNISLTLYLCHCN